MSDNEAPARSAALAKTIEDLRTKMRVELKLMRIRLEWVERALDRSTTAVNGLEARLTYVEQRIGHQADRIITQVTGRGRAPEGRG